MNITYFVNGINQIGGAEIATRNLAEQMAKRGHNVTLISTEGITDWRKHFSVVDYTSYYRLIRLPTWQRSRTTFTQTLVAQALWSFPILLQNVDILHLRGLTPETIILATMAHKLGIKTLCVPMSSGIHGDAAQFPKGKVQTQRLEAFDMISALTEPLKNELILWGYAAENISVIPNGVDIKIFNLTKKTPSACSVIFVGQFRPEKRVDLLLQAWMIVQNEHPRAELTLLGGGRYLYEYQQLAYSNGVRAKFVPNTDKMEVLTHLRRNSIFVLPGISEGMSNALLEAMAVGLAPIVSQTPANCAVISPNFNGLCYNPNSAEDLAAKIIHLINDSILRAQLGKNARQTVEACYTLDSVVDQYLTLYTRMLG